MCIGDCLYGHCPFCAQISLYIPHLKKRGWVVDRQYSLLLDEFIIDLQNEGLIEDNEQYMNEPEKIFSETDQEMIKARFHTFILDNYMMDLIYKSLNSSQILRQRGLMKFSYFHQFYYNL